MKKINLTTKEIIKASLPKFLKGLKQKSLNDLYWTDESLGLRGFGFWKESTLTPTYDNTTHKLDGINTESLDEDNKLVIVTQGVIEKTAEELELESIELENALKSEYKNYYLAVIQTVLKEKDYDSIEMLNTWLDDESFGTESTKIKAWYKSIIKKNIEILGNVKSGAIELPSKDEYLEMLPKYK